MFIKSENPSEKKIEMHVQFEKCNFKIENTKIRIGKSEKIRFLISLRILILIFKIYLGFTLQTSVSLTLKGTV